MNQSTHSTAGYAEAPEAIESAQPESAAGSGSSSREVLRAAIGRKVMAWIGAGTATGEMLTGLSETKKRLMVEK